MTNPTTSASSTIARMTLFALLMAVGSPVAAQVVHESLGDGVVRSFASAAEKVNAEASVALLADPAAVGPAPTGFGPLPTFSVNGGRQTVTVQINPGTNLYATGFQSGPMERSGRRVEYYNLDNFAWGDFSNRNYQTHPWVLGVREDGSAFGVLFDSTWRSSLDLESPQIDGAIFQTEGPSPRVITITADDPQGVVEKLAELTGAPFMPPMWSIGYHQSKFSYTPQSVAVNVAQEFRNRSIPAEVMWMDIDFMDGFRNFTFNPFDFPDPAALNAQLDSIGFQGVWMANCGIKAEGGYFAFDQLQALNLGVQRSNTSTFFGEVWPGNSVWPDFTMQATRDWWADRVADFASIGIDGIWNDMNEPAVFNVASKTMPDDNRHRADADLGGAGPHAKYHNIYGMQMSRATREGMLQANPNKRPFVLTRAGYIGGQRYAAMWTGDNVANWYHVDVSIQNILNIGMSGQPNCGPDIGGFNGDSGPDMYARWMGLGAMMPFARGHYGFSGRDREPWSYGIDTENTSRLALNRRYRLLNYFYTQFHEAHATGLPVCRPLFFAEPSNPSLRFYDDGFLVGPGLLVVGATQPGAVPQIPPMEPPVYRFAFPQTNNLASPRDDDDGDLPDLYVLGGHIIVANQIVQHSRELTPQRNEPIELIIGLDDTGFASGVFYEDAGDGFEYESGAFMRATFIAQRTGDDVTIDIASIEGDLPMPARPVRIRVQLGDDEQVTFTTLSTDFPATFAMPEPAPDTQPDPDLRDGRLIGDAFGETRLLATNERDRFSELSQLRALYARPGEDGIEIGIEGELAIDGTAFALFLDTRPGGQNVISTSNLPPPPGGLSALTGTTLEPGFDADFMLFANAFDGSVFSDWVTLDSGAAGSKTYLGRQFVGSGGSVLQEGQDNLGIEVALGSAGHAAGSGFEIFIPYTLIGEGQGLLGEAKLFAAVLKSNGNVTNQTLPQSENNWPGFSPNFGAIAGQQFARVLLRPNLNGDGVVDAFDVITYLQLAEANDLSADLVEPFGIVDGADIEAVMRLAYPE